MYIFALYLPVEAFCTACSATTQSKRKFLADLSGYIGLTDPKWYMYLLGRERVDEVNFWQPHGGRVFHAVKPGEPFFFKLRAPYRKIAGFGFFERFESLPAWLAWDCFGEMNGAPDFEGMMDRINRLRRNEEKTTGLGDFMIGCILISAPVFFTEENWVDPPHDWARSGIQQGKRYDLQEGEGRRLLEECLDRARTVVSYWNVDPVPVPVAEPEERYGSPISVRPRLGQGLFSLAVRDAYRGACAVTHEHSSPVLEAAHIKPYSHGGEHQVYNGILLRRDLHRLFDRGYVTITPDYIFRVGDRLRDEFQNGHSYYGLDTTTIAIPENKSSQPRRELLDWHGREIYKG